MIEVNKLTKWIENDNLDLSNFVLNYIVESNQGSLEITKLVLKQYLKFKNHYDSFNLLYHILKLPRDVEILEEILKLDENDSNSIYYKNQIIAQSDLDILKENPHIRPNLDYSSKLLDTRIHYSEISTSALWNELWDFTNQLANEPQNNHFSQGFLIIDELVERNDFPIDQLRQKLNEYKTDHSIEDDFYYWNHIFLCKLIGKIQLVEGIPYLFLQLKEEADLLNEIASESLILMQHDDVLNTIHSHYQSESNQFQTYVLSILEKIKTKQSEEILLDLFQKESDRYHKTMIARALCHQLSIKAIPLVAQLVKNGYDQMYTLLEKSLYYNCLVNGIQHVDLHKWEMIVNKEKQHQHDRRQALTELVNKNKVKKNNKENQTNQKTKIGRNEPCPCGSGKKYKHCCNN